MSENSIWKIINRYFDGFRTSFDPDLFAEKYHNFGPMPEGTKGSRNKQEFLKEMAAFSQQMPLDKRKGDKGLSFLAQSYDEQKEVALVFYQMHFSNGFILDVVDIFKIRDNKIVEITGVFDPRPFL